MKKIMLLMAFACAAMLVACEAATTTRFLDGGCLVIDNPGNVLVLHGTPTFADYVLARVRFRIAPAAGGTTGARFFAVGLDPAAVRGAAGDIVTAASAHPLPIIDTVFSEDDWAVELTYALGRGWYLIRIRVYTADGVHFTVALCDPFLSGTDPESFTFLASAQDPGAAIYGAAVAAFAEQYPMK